MKAVLVVLICLYNGQCAVWKPARKALPVEVCVMLMPLQQALAETMTADMAEPHTVAVACVPVGGDHA